VACFIVGFLFLTIVSWISVPVLTYIYDGANPPGGGDNTYPIHTMITLHVLAGGYTSDKGKIRKLLDKAKDLNAEYIRTDFWWGAFEPQPGVFNEDTKNFYRWFIDEVKKRGLKIVAIIGTGIPSWVGGYKKIFGFEFIRGEFIAYVERVVKSFGEDIYYYQLLNEPNHAPTGLSDREEAQLIKAAVEVLRREDSSFKTMINMLCDFHSWKDDFIKFLDTYGLENYIDVLGIDHYPGTWSPYQSYDHWSELVDLFNLIANRYPGKEAAVIETGFATAEYDSLNNLYMQKKQEEFINAALPKIRSIARNPDKSKGVRLRFIGWYELADEPWKDIPKEPYFGILMYLNGNFYAKMGYDDLKYQFKQFLN